MTPEMLHYLLQRPLSFCFDGFQKLGVSNTDSNGINFDLTVSTDAGVLYNKFMNWGATQMGRSRAGWQKLPSTATLVVA